ncbi:MAG: hypothetical protein WC560_12890, partial [Syntrophales bacterium]
MLVFLRTFPILSGLTMAIGSMALFWFPGQPFIVLVSALAVLFFLLAKLAGWNFKKNDFWVLFGIPFFLALASFFLLFFIEGSTMKVLVITLATFLIWLFAENLFTYLQLPNAYQVNALEYLSLVINMVSVYFFTTGIFAARLFLGLPLWLTLPLFAGAIFLMIAATLWICKIEKDRLIPSALGGTILFTELFFVFTLLPSGFFP